MIVFLLLACDCAPDLLVRKPEGPDGPPAIEASEQHGGIAQLGERVLCKHEVVGSIPSASTNNSLRSKERQQARALDRRQRFARQNVRAGASGYNNLIQEKNKRYRVSG